MRHELIKVMRGCLPGGVRRTLSQRAQRLLRPAWLGTIRRTRPLSDHWGADRGTPVDRYYIQQFIAEHRADVRGRVLEVRDSRYTQAFGEGVTAAEVLDVDRSNPRATIVADLSVADAVPEGQFDCFILTQTLQFILPLTEAIAQARRLLRPGGVLLATVPAVSRIDVKSGPASDFWRLTPASCDALFGRTFGPQNVAVRSYGNVLTCVAFLAGMAREELSARELAAHDPSFPLVVAVRAVRR